MDFPHLKDTQFPLIDNVNVYKYQNNFDYARWNGKVSFKLLNVLWNSNYADVPYFENVSERDKWFDSQNGYVGTLDSLFNNTPDNTIRIPIPYNDAYNYNYLVVDMPIQTSIDNPINYEDSNIRVKRWFYFIEDMTQYAPSTTELQISVDYWTTFIHSVEIPYLMLERGHAPMTKTNVDTYLKNPIANNEYLLADDFNYGGESIIQTTNYIPVGNGKKYVLFCAPYTDEDFDKFDGTKWSGNSTLPTYSDTNERWGYQIQVNNYAWKYGNTDYRQADLPIHNGVQSGVLNGCECFAIEGIYAQDFFNEMAKYHVNFIHGIQAMFMLDETLFDRSHTFTFNGYTLYVADKKIKNLEINFNKAMFGFDSKYSNITKLYTFPYSSLEITDDDGNYFNARIENCGHVKMQTEVSLVYPFLNYNVFFSGINGDGELTYQWEPVYGGKHDKPMWASDFSKFMMNWNIPVYTIFVSSENEYAANNAAGMDAKRSGAIKDYENAVRYANTARENTAASFATNTANVNRSSQAMIDNTELGNDNRTDNKDYTKAKLAADAENQQGQNGAIRDNQNALLDKDCATKNTLTANTVSNTNEAAVVSSAANAIGSALSGGIALAAAAPKHPVVTGAAVAAGAIASTVSTFASVDAKSNNAKEIQAANAASRQNGQDYNNTACRISNDYIDYNTTNALTFLDNTTEVNNDTDTAQTANTTSANNANAAATQSTETSNATYNRNATVEAEKANLVQKQKEAEAQYRNARLQKPAQYGKYGGDFAPDVYLRRGVRLNIRTQPKSAIAQTGDAFLRFGYALHRVWDMSKGFHYCKEFTFWKAEDIWINDGSGVANVATNAIGNILMKGVTVWRNPDKIGTIGIYDNF